MSAPDGLATELTAELAAYYDYLTIERNRSPRTVESYESDLKQLLEFLAAQNEPSLKGLNQRLVRKYLIARDKAGDGPATRNRKLTSIRSFLHYLYRRGKIKDDFSDLLQSAKMPKRMPHNISEDEAQNLLEEPEVPKKIHDSLEPWRLQRDHIIATLLYATGIRVSELTGLTLGSLSIAGRMIKVMGKGRKERIVPLPEAILGDLEYYLQKVRPTLLGGKESQALFPGPDGRPLTRQSVNLRLAALGQGNGLMKHITPHMLRHSYATHLLAHHADLRSIQLLLGHTGLGATQRYTALSLQELQDTYLKAHPHGK